MNIKYLQTILDNSPASLNKKSDPKMNMISGLYLLLTCTLLISIIPSPIMAEPAYCSSEADESLQTHTLTGESGENIDLLVSLLKQMGIDLSYGDEGDTIFSMVDTSLTRIISSLSSGNTEGFMEIPLIHETLASFGLTADDVVIDPSHSSGEMEATQSYQQNYETGRETSHSV